MLLYEPGRGNYVQDRREFLKGITVEKVKDDILESNIRALRFGLLNPGSK